MTAAFRFESFADAEASGRRMYDQEALDGACELARQAGRQEAQDQAVESLHAALIDLAAEITRHSAELDDIRQSVERTILPLIPAILRALAPAARHEMLEQAIRSELHKLFETAPTLTCTIRAPEKVLSSLRTDLPIPGEALAFQPSKDGGAEIKLSGGRIVIDTEQFESDLTRLIESLYDSEE